MKYIFKELHEKSIWNTFLGSFATTNQGIPVNTFIQSFNWLEFQKSNGNQIYPLAIYDEANNIVGLSAGVIIRARRGNYLYVRNGPVIDWSNIELVNQLTTHLKDYARKQELWFIRISPLIEKNSIAEKFIQNQKWVDCPMHDVEALDTWIINVQRKEDEIFNDQRKKTRYEIRKAEKLGIETVITQDPVHIQDYYEILKDTVQRQGWNAYSLKYIQREFEAFVKDKMATIILMRYENKYIAGGIFIHFNRQTFYHYGASLTAYKHLPAAYLMIWEAIKLSQKRKDLFFNFWGITPENKKNHPWDGLTQFKMKFNGQAQRWAQSKDIPVSKKYWLTNLYERIDKHRKGY